MAESLSTTTDSGPSVQLDAATDFTERQSFQLNGAGLTLLVTAIWAVLSVRRPELTYHFGPLLAAATWPASLRRRPHLSVRSRVAAAVGSFTIVAATGLALDSADKLLGPTFWHTRPAISEVLWFGLAGSVGGAMWATLYTRDR